MMHLEERSQLFQALISVREPSCGSWRLPDCRAGADSTSSERCLKAFPTTLRAAALSLSRVVMHSMAIVTLKDGTLWAMFATSRNGFRCRCRLNTSPPFQPSCGCNSWDASPSLRECRAQGLLKRHMLRWLGVHASLQVIVAVCNPTESAGKPLTEGRSGIGCRAGSQA